MGDKEILLKELKEEFEKSRKELNFKVSYNEIEREFKIEDAILSMGFVSTNFSRQLCSRILENYMGWHNYLNGLLIPSTGYFSNQIESKLFSSKEDKEIMWNLIKKIMIFSSEHSLIDLNKDKKRESKFIDETFSYWVKKFNPEIIKILSKVNSEWKN